MPFLWAARVGLYDQQDSTSDMSSSRSHLLPVHTVMNSCSKSIGLVATSSSSGPHLKKYSLWRSTLQGMVMLHWVGKPFCQQKAVIQEGGYKIHCGFQFGLYSHVDQWLWGQPADKQRSRAWRSPQCCGFEDQSVSEMRSRFPAPDKDIPFVILVYLSLKDGLLNRRKENHGTPFFFYQNILIAVIPCANWNTSS